MKVTGIVFIVLGLLAIAFNCLMIPKMQFSQTGDSAYDTGYNIGLFIFAIGGFILFIIGIVLVRAGARKEKAEIARRMHEQQYHQQYQQQYYQQQQPPRTNTY